MLSSLTAWEGNTQYHLVSCVHNQGGQPPVGAPPQTYAPRTCHSVLHVIFSHLKRLPVRQPHHAMQGLPAERLLDGTSRSNSVHGLSLKLTASREPVLQVGAKLGGRQRAGTHTAIPAWREQVAAMTSKMNSKLCSPVHILTQGGTWAHDRILGAQHPKTCFLPLLKVVPYK